MTIQWDVGTPRDTAGADPERDQVQCDRTLMQGIQAGDRTSLQSLMNRYWAPLVGYAAARTACREDAEDVVQETFVRVWRHREKWNASGSVSAYLYRITRNLALNSRRDRRAQWNREDRSGADLYGSAAASSPEDDYESQTLNDDVQRAINELSERRREIFMLSRFHGLSHREIAQTLGLSPQTVANHMTSALADLRKSLAQYLQIVGVSN
jgi:RNA polymerase sigma-70 factor, ECF subfamily